MPPDEPLVVILGGINGAGKTTASEMLLGKKLSSMPFVNADTIARGLNSGAPESVALAAGRIMLKRLDELAEAKDTFAFESTLAGKTYLPFLRRLRGSGYRVELYYFWLPSPELSIGRVRMRVQTGGHHIPDDTIRQRYSRSLLNFWNGYRGLADLWMMYNNVGRLPALTAFGSCMEEPDVTQPTDFQLFQELISHATKPDNRGADQGRAEGDSAGGS